MYRLLAFLVASFSASASSGSEITFSTFLGGSGFDAATAIAVDDVAGNRYICGWTESADFPSLARLGGGGGVDAWVAKLRPDRPSDICHRHRRSGGRSGTWNRD